MYSFRTANDLESIKVENLQMPDSHSLTSSIMVRFSFLEFTIRYTLYELFCKFKLLS